MNTPRSRWLATLSVALLASCSHAFQPEAVAPKAPAAPSVESLFPPRFGTTDVPQRTPGSIRVATYNIENLFDDVDDPALSDRQEDIDDLKPEGQMDAVALAIRAIDADILCLEEIESRAALDWFMSGRLEDMGYAHIVSIDAGDERGIEQAILSRFPIVDSKNWVQRPLGGVHPEKYGTGRNWHAGKDIVFHRSPLMGVIEIPGAALERDEAYRLRVIAVHHKSGRHSDYWRDREAAGLLEVLTELDAGRDAPPTLILGDFNAEPGAPSVQAYVDHGYTDLFADNPGPDTRWTTHESGRRIDLILANEGARAAADPDSEFVFGTPARPSEFSWRELDTFPGYASDHYPVVVDLRPARAANAQAGESP